MMSNPAASQSAQIGSSIDSEFVAQRWAGVDVDVDVIRANVATIARRVAPSQVWAIVKANGYGHGAVPVAWAALAGGATGLGVALVSELVELRDAGIEAPVLVLTQPPPAHIGAALAAAATMVVYDPSYVALLGRAARAAAVTVDVHVHVDTGMSRVGVAVDRAVQLASMIDTQPGLRRVGLMTHLACADEVEASANPIQIEAFDQVVEAFTAAGLDPGVVHIANSAGGLAHPAARRTLVRAGIAIYGISPGAGCDPLVADLQPALTLRANVSFVKPVRAGTQVSYGWRHQCATPTVLATVPLGYADGVPRRLGTGSTGAPGHDVLIGGRRHPIVGVVTMDQLVVDVGSAPVTVGDEVVLIGRQGEEMIRVSDWAQHLDTIGYEVVCGLRSRLPRRYVNSSDSTDSSESVG